MRIRISLLFVLFVFIIGCKDKNKLPKDVMPRDKMQAVLWDMLRAGEFLDSYVFNKDTAVNKVAESEKWYSKIYAIHGITKEQFKKSFAFYKDDLPLLKPILDSLSKKEMQDNADTLSQSNTAEQRPIDSNLLKRKDSLEKLSLEIQKNTQIK